MNLLEKFKNIIKRKPQSIENTGLSKIDTSLIYIPELKEISLEDKDKVLEYIKEIDISNLESIINYASDLNEKANSNTEILMRLYYRLVDETEIKLDTDNIIYDKYNTLININELNLCKGELLNLRKEGILKVIALEEVLKKESSRKLFFSSIFGKYEKLKRKSELNSLMDAIERTKVVIKVIEQLIQTVNINVSSELLKVTSENILLNIIKEENNDSVIEELINETKSMLKTFLPEYEGNFVFDTKNINECIVNLSIAKRLLDLYAYKHKDEAEKVLYEDIRNFRETEFLATEKENTKEKIETIENRIKLFKYYIKDKDVFRINVQIFYDCKFNYLIRDILNLNESPFKNIKNKLELEYYENIISKMIEDLIVGNNSLITDNPNLPNFSSKKQRAIQYKIISILKENFNDLSGKNFMDKSLLCYVFSLSTHTNFNYKERHELMHEFLFTINSFSKKYYNLEKELEIIILLFKIFMCYEEYNSNHELTQSFPISNITIPDEFVYFTLSEYEMGKSSELYVEYYFDILQTSKLCIILPGIYKIVNNNNEKKYSLNNLPATKIVLGKDLREIQNCFNNCQNLKMLDARYINARTAEYLHAEYSFNNNCLEELVMNYKLIKDISHYSGYEQKIKNVTEKKLPHFASYYFREKSILRVFCYRLKQDIKSLKTFVIIDEDIWYINVRKLLNKEMDLKIVSYDYFDYAGAIEKNIEIQRKDPSRNQSFVFSLTEHQRENFSKSMVDFNWNDYSNKLKMRKDSKNI